MRKGFTLIELLSVIIILGVIFIFIFPKLSSLINRGKEVNIEIIKNKLVESTMEYAEKYNPRLSNKLINEGDNYVVSGKKLVDLGLVEQDDIDSIENFSRVKCTLDENEKVNCEIMYKPVKECTYEGELVQGAEFIDGQYTYHYKQYFGGSSWSNISTNGWGVKLTDLTSTDPVTSKLCTTINDKPIIDMRNMFKNSKATSIDLSSFDTSNVTNMSYMFYISDVISIDLSGFDTSKVTTTAHMFSGSKATTINLGDFDTSNVTNMRDMFKSTMSTKIDISSFNTSNVTDMSSIFATSTAIEIILPEKWSTGNNATLASMFSRIRVKELDLRGFDTSKVRNMSSMFYNSSVGEIKGISDLNTSNVTNMSSMFYYTRMGVLDLSGFDTSNVANMSSMFYKSRVTMLDLSGFATNNVTNMTNMFRECGALKTIYVSNSFVTDQLTNHSDMFTDSNKLVGGNGTTYSSSYVDKTYARVDTTDTPGYFTLKSS